MSDENFCYGFRYKMCHVETESLCNSCASRISLWQCENFGGAVEGASQHRSTACTSRNSPKQFPCRKARIFGEGYFVPRGNFSIQYIYRRVPAHVPRIPDKTTHGSNPTTVPIHLAFRSNPAPARMHKLEASAGPDTEMSVQSGIGRRPSLLAVNHVCRAGSLPLSSKHVYRFI